jgi:hypothetical protein
MPEGSITNGMAILGLRTGAFVVDAPVLPMVFKYTMSTGASAATTGPTPLHDLVIAMRFFFDPFKVVEVTILPEMKIASGETPRDFADRVGRRMAAELGLPYLQGTTSAMAMPYWTTMKRRVAAGLPWIVPDAYERSLSLVRKYKRETVATPGTCPAAS